MTPVQILGLAVFLVSAMICVAYSLTERSLARHGERFTAAAQSARDVRASADVEHVHSLAAALRVVRETR